MCMGVNFDESERTNLYKTQYIKIIGVNEGKYFYPLEVAA